ncbi:MAG: pilus assembly FimT family protein [Planctomycetota bacterium]|jgi:hypothetical protein
MKPKARHSGMTLPEITVVILGAALLVSLAVPATRALLDSFDSPGSTRAIAKEQRCIGIRFQNRYDKNDIGCQYMVFIVHDPEMARLYSSQWELPGRIFRAVEGVKPVKLPDSVGVMDLERGAIGQSIVGDSDFGADILNDWVFTDTTTFSIVFAPSGKLAVREVQVRNRDGFIATSPWDSKDDLFNKSSNVASGLAMFCQDDYSGSGFKWGAQPKQLYYLRPQEIQAGL